MPVPVRFGSVWYVDADLLSEAVNCYLLPVSHQHTEQPCTLTLLLLLLLFALLRSRPGLFLHPPVTMSAMRVDAKVVMLGKESVGKTSLVERYVHHRFLVGPYQNTIGAAFVAKPIQVGEKVITLGIWDTAGSERYEAMSRIYYRGARAALVCYDMTDSSSFQRARFWVKELQNCEEHCKIYLCGTKSDLIEGDRSLRQIDYHDAQDFADEIGALHYETSSKTGNNVDELFQKVAEDYNSTAFQYMTPEELGVDLGQKKDSYFYSCCHNN